MTTTQPAGAQSPSELQGGPCIVCGLRNYNLSFGGPGICPACDCGRGNNGLTKAQKLRIQELETALQSAHAALAEAQMTVRNLELANGEARKTIDRLSAMCPQDACNGSPAALPSTGEGSGG